MDELSLPFSLSPSLKELYSPFGSSPVSAWNIVQELLSTHSRYGGGLAGSLAKISGSGSGTSVEQKPVDEWLQACAKAHELSTSQRLDTTLVLVGLAHLDPAIKRRLETNNFLRQLVTEYFDPSRVSDFVPIKTVLTDEVLFSVRRSDYSNDFIHTSTLDELRKADTLDIEPEVRTIAHLMLARDVDPPLAIGLFGDWGSGKSFFMTMLQKYLEKAAEEIKQEQKAYQATPNGSGRGGTRWCMRIVQVNFNAWHFSDSHSDNNLWANLVTKISAAVDDNLVMSQARSYEDKIRESEQALETAKSTEVDKQGELETAQEAEMLAAQAVADAEATARNQLQIAKIKERSIKGVARILQPLVPVEAQQAYANLGTLNLSGNSFLAQLSILPKASGLGVVIVIVAIIITSLIYTLIQLLLDTLNVTIPQLVEWLIKIASFISSAALLLSKGLDTASQGLKEVQAITVVSPEKVADDPEVQQAREALGEKHNATQAALMAHKEAKREVRKAEKEVELIKPMSLFALLSGEGIKEAKEHLGYISQIRDYFERMSEILQFGIKRYDDDKDKEIPIQRIILYIDDLDRCQPGLVVKVLEAVHLLLAFPLFMVVVGVDPRWLRHSLAYHYSQTLRDQPDNGQNEPNADDDVEFGTPQDYLEKIFQIPFALRPMQEDGFENLVTNLLDGNSNRRSKGGFRESWRGRSESVIRVEEGDSGGGVVGGGSSGAGRGSGVVGGGSSGNGGSLEPFQTERLDFRSWERKDMNKLWHFFRTPRSVKRFVNCYRLIRASLASARDVRVFEGTENAPGEYQIVMILLAVVTAYPNQTTRFLNILQKWGQAFSETPEKEVDWQEILTILQQPGANAAPKGSPKSPQGQGPTRTKVDNASMLRWNMLLKDLKIITDPKKSFSQPFQIKQLQDWARRVVRYSFSIVPALEE